MLRRILFSGVVASAGFLGAGVMAAGPPAHALTIPAITIPAIIPTTTTVAITESSAFPTALLATATVSPGLLITPTGTVTFTMTTLNDGKVFSVTDPLSSGCVLLLTSCTATQFVPKVSEGVIVVATYNGDDLSQPSTGAAGFKP
jgi:hypothetical protein